jgi:hypothetical protein
VCNSVKQKLTMRKIKDTNIFVDEVKTQLR